MPKETFYNLSDVKKNKILDAAIDEFAENDYHQANVTGVIEKSGIASGSFYQYFDGKKDLYKYLIGIILKRKLKYLNKEVMNSPEQLNFFDLLRQLYKGGIQFAEENPRLVAIGNNFINSKSKVCIDIREKQKPMSNQYFEKLIKYAIKKGDVKKDIDPAFTAKFLTSVNYALSDFIYAEEGLKENTMVIIDDLINIIESGLKK
ncbi:MAG: TetR/AcrR family transcriptional regulator [Halanaerobiales bacterium]|nr:TetR/AcrR family transcriptional regulator [Halanaerobiales bacterium]